MFESWPIAFAVTVVVEALVAIIWARRTRRRPPLLDLVVLNLITHPAAFVASTSTAIPFVPIELVVIGLEAVGYRFATRYTWSDALALSVFANVASLSLSFL